MFTAFQVIHLGDKERPSVAAERSADGRDGRVVRRPAAESHSATNSTTLQLHHNLDSNYIPSWLRWLFLSATNYARPSQLNVESLQFTVHPENWRCWWAVRRNNTTITLISRGCCLNITTDWLYSMLHNFNLHSTKTCITLFNIALEVVVNSFRKKGTNKWMK